MCSVSDNATVASLVYPTGAIAIMPSITNIQMSITTHRPQNEALLIVTCGVEFTEVEVNAMNLLGLAYRLDCSVLNVELLDDDAVVTFEPYTFSRHSGGAHYYEGARFETTAPMYNLNERLIGKDKLVAKLTLTNEETKAEVVGRSDEIQVDLAA
jgi:hypothetical protein